MTGRRHALALTVVAVTVTGAAWIGAQVFDWKRDFTTNVAETAADADDPRLRPLVIAGTPENTAAAVTDAAASLRRWAYVGRTTDGSVLQLAFTRSTRLFRFVDDVTVRIEARGDTSIVHARSASRVGKGDWGQNPRNIAELFAAVRARSGR